MAKQEIDDQGGTSTCPEPVISTTLTVRRKINEVPSLQNVVGPTEETNYGIVTDDSLRVGIRTAQY